MLSSLSEMLSLSSCPVGGDKPEQSDGDDTSGDCHRRSVWHTQLLFHFIYVTETTVVLIRT